MKEQEKKSLSEAARLARNAYMREYSKTHPRKKPVSPEKRREYQNRYWEKKAQKLAEGEQDDNEKR